MAIDYKGTLYESLANDNVRFFQGTQAQLNLYLSNAPATIPSGMTGAGGTNIYKGAAIEGAFYLTTDTHRLYIGRKVASSTEVYPEEVSSGISVIATAGDLPSPAGGEARDGDLYYIKDGNILAAYEATYDSVTGLPTGGTWVQLNSATGVSEVQRQLGTKSNGAITYSDSIIAANAPGGIDSTILVFKEGDNITLTNATQTNGDPTLEISATDTLYSIGTATATNAATLKLSPSTTDATHTESTVAISGTNTTAVSSDASGNIVIAGVSFKNGNNELGVTIEPKASSANGFLLGFDYMDGGSNSVTGISHYQHSDFDPVLRYGATATDVIHFVNGEANLTSQYYTKTEVAGVIQDAIDTNLATANAMTYKGAISSVADLPTTSDAKGAKIGDTYKVSATAGITVPGVGTANLGDLIIIKSSTGAENASGTIDAANITYDVIPSGDEPFVQSDVSVSATANDLQTVIGLTDVKGNNDILSTKWTGKTVANGGSGKIEVTSAFTAGHSTAPHEAIVTLEHAPITRTDATNIALTSSSATDSIGSGAVQLFLMSNATSTTATMGGLMTDSTGHVVGLRGQTYTFKHNRITNHDVTLNASSISTSGTYLTGARYGTISINVKDSYSGDKEAVFSIKSDSLRISKNDNEAAAIHVNMVWESF